MATGELIAWQAGADWAADGYALAELATLPTQAVHERLSGQARRALGELAPAVFWAWFGRGYQAVAD